jgi:hypothetical protein
MTDAHTIQFSLTGLIHSNYFWGSLAAWLITSAVILIVGIIAKGRPVWKAILISAALYLLCSVLFYYFEAYALWNKLFTDANYTGIYDIELACDAINGIIAYALFGWLIVTRKGVVKLTASGAESQIVNWLKLSAFAAIVSFALFYIYSLASGNMGDAQVYLGPIVFISMLDRPPQVGGMLVLLFIWSVTLLLKRFIGAESTLGLIGLGCFVGACLFMVFEVYWGLFWITTLSLSSLV